MGRYDKLLAYVAPGETVSSTPALDFLDAISAANHTQDVPSRG